MGGREGGKLVSDRGFRRPFLFSPSWISSISFSFWSLPLTIRDPNALIQKWLLIQKDLPVVDEGALVPIKDEPAPGPHADARTLLAQVAAARTRVQDYLLAQLNLKEQTS